MFLYKYKGHIGDIFMGISSNLNITAPKNNLNGLGRFSFQGGQSGQTKTPAGNTSYLSAQTSGLMGETSFVRAEGGRPDRFVGENLRLIA